MPKLTHNLFILLILLLFANQYLLFQIINQKITNTSVFSQIVLPISASESEIAKAVIPGDKDNLRPYKWKDQEVTLKGYAQTNGRQFTEMNKEITLDSLSPELKSRYQKLAGNIYHPCCDAPISQCGCIHALAGMGIVKFLLQEGWEDQKIQEEVFLWSRYWFPKHYVAATIYLRKQGTDPFKLKSAEWLSASLSTVKAGRKIGANLGIQLY